jgi:hypothetical protein
VGKVPQNFHIASGEMKLCPGECRDGLRYTLLESTFWRVHLSLDHFYLLEVVLSLTMVLEVADLFE